MTQVTVDLGKIKFNWRGAYDPAVTYYKDDVVSYGGSSHVLKVTSSTAVAPVYVNGVHAAWDLMAQGGDPSSIMTTQGDLLLRDSSGLARLPIGTTDQVLMVDSAGTGLTYGSVTYPGQVMEVLTGQCDGSQVTVRSGTYTLPNVTTWQNFSTSYQTITGSEFAYTPPTGATRVFYDFEWLQEDESYGGISHHKFFIDNVEVTTARQNVNSQYSTSSHGQHIRNFTWVVDCNASADNTSKGAFTSWTSPKTMKWMSRDYSGSYQIRAHYNTWWDGSGATGSNVFRIPKLTITAIA